MRKILIAIILIAVNALFGDVVRRGVAIPDGAKPTPLAAVLARPNAFAKQTIVTEGVVESVCFFAGCWMRVAPAAGQDGMRVTFAKGVTVPRGSKGRHARLIGRVTVTAQKAAFVASGVELTGGTD